MNFWKISFLILLILIMVISYGFLKTSSNKPSEPPNWENKNITYKVIKEDENYLIEYKLNDTTGKYFVGNSLVELDAYLNTNVKIIGSFPKRYNDKEASVQCIRNRCHLIFKKSIFLSPNMITSTIDIDEIK